MSGHDKLQKIEETLAAGHTIYISTYLSSIKVTPKTVKKWAANGHQLFKATEKSVYIARGKNFDCIDGCEITFE